MKSQEAANGTTTHISEASPRSQTAYISANHVHVIPDRWRGNASKFLIAA
jgi:hypothetical protein